MHPIWPSPAAMAIGISTHLPLTSEFLIFRRSRETRGDPDQICSAAPMPDALPRSADHALSSARRPGPAPRTPAPDLNRTGVRETPQKISQNFSNGPPFLPSVVPKKILKNF